VTHIAFALASATALVAARPSAADGVDAVGAYKKARDEALPKLRALAAWCEGEKLILERDRACEGVLALDPDDAAARKTLHYSRGKDGKWTRGIVPRSSPTDPSRAAEMSAKRADAIGAYRARVFELIHADDAPVADRERALDELVGVDPDDAETRAATRETRVGDKWLLSETVTAKTRRKELVAAVAAARKAGAPPDKSPPSADESAICSKWTDVRDIGLVRVLGGPNVLEAESVGRAADIVLTTCKAVTGVDSSPKVRVRLFMFCGLPDGLAAVNRDARVSAEDREWAKSLTSFPVQDTNDVYVWPADAATRVESGLRQVVIECLWRAFAVKSKPIWAREGLCHWWSEAVLSTHFCFFLRKSEYADPTKKADDLHKRLFENASDWLAEARALEKGPNWPDLRVTLARDASTATAEDALVAYLLTRYLVEGRPDVYADVMRAVGSGATPDAWTGSVLGSTVEGLDRRLRRWLRETK
jgi:hypothetical protein